MNRKATNAAVKAELGRHAILPDLIAHAAKYWLRLCSHNPTSLAYKAYLDMFLDSDKKTTENWATEIKNIWNKFGMTGIWENQGTIYPKKTVKLLKERMINRYEHNWLAHVGLSPTFKTVNTKSGNKLRTYIQFKHTIRLENYIVAEKNCKCRQDMAKLRISGQ